jgi:hypothetical protein
MPQDRLAQAAKQGDFYQKNFRRLLKVIYGLLILTYGLVGFIAYQYFSAPPSKYFVTTTDGQLIEIKPS